MAEILTRRLFIAAAISALALPGAASADDAARIQELEAENARLKAAAEKSVKSLATIQRELGVTENSDYPNTTDNFVQLAKVNPNLHIFRRSIGFTQSYLPSLQNPYRQGSCFILAKDGDSIYVSVTRHQLHANEQKIIDIYFLPSEKKMLKAKAEIIDSESPLDLMFARIDLAQFGPSQLDIREQFNSELRPVKWGSNQDVGISEDSSKPKSRVMFLGFPIVATKMLLDASFGEIDFQIKAGKTAPVGIDKKGCTIKSRATIYHRFSGGPAIRDDVCLGSIMMSGEHSTAFPATYFIPGEVIQNAFYDRFPDVAERAGVVRSNGPIVANCRVQQDVTMARPQPQ